MIGGVHSMGSDLVNYYLRASICGAQIGALEIDPSDIFLVQVENYMLL